MSRNQLDQFIDDEEEQSCPLCVEELDLSDRNFRPCPCGYQVCQFCYNNIKTTMNGLCPACRRPYDDKNIEFKQVTQEEIAAHRVELMQNAKKKADARKKEALKREADSASRKHLAGLRVVQKNLVYVTGLTPTTREDRLLETLRGDQYFGQYGKIIKIVVSKAKPNHQGQESVGVYVTFARKDDAAACIAAVDGSQNGERTLRAQYGTTKYCSAYLRNEECKNRNCMFLHEPGEENESFTRQDLSSMNVISTQQPSQTPSSARPPQPQPPPQQGPHAIAAANISPSDDPASPAASSGDGPALPATASWAKQAQQSRRPSRTATSSATSPHDSSAAPASPSEDSTKAEAEPAQETEGAKMSKPASPQPQPPSVTDPRYSRQPSRYPELDHLFKVVSSPDFKYEFSVEGIEPKDLEVIRQFPPLFDLQAGGRRKAMLRQKEEERRRQQEVEAQVEAQATSITDPEEHGLGGSLQLGGEPEERPDGMHNQRSAIQPPQQGLGSASLGLGDSLSDDISSVSLRSGNLTPQQQQQLLLQQFKNTGPQSNNFLGNLQPGQPQQHGGGGHARQTSRFSFANDSSASTSVKPVANPKLMTQQSSMMPQNQAHGNMSQHQPLGNQFYSGVQGPPPGLKTTGTPPVSGGGMFGQGHGFATGGLGYGANAAGRNPANEELIRDLMGRRGTGGGNQLLDAGKRESMFPSFLHQHPPTSSAPAPGLLSFPYGQQPGAYQDSGAQKQKKKGKKHRHANTSSSSGGGVVDVADPSILQARLHQGGVMGGQGLYAGQGQGGFSSMYSGGIGRWQ